MAESLTAWVFKQKGVLRVGEVKHHLKGEKQAPEAYTVMEDVVSSSDFLDPLLKTINSIVCDVQAGLYCSKCVQSVPIVVSLF